MRCISRVRASRSAALIEMAWMAALAVAVSRMRLTV
jgi:hypothetical protein